MPDHDRRDRGPSVPRVRHCRPAPSPGFAGYFPAERGRGDCQISQSARGGAAEGDGEDGDLVRHQLPWRRGAGGPRPGRPGDGALLPPGPPPPPRRPPPRHPPPPPPPAPAPPPPP